MTLTGLASANASDTSVMFGLFSVGCVCYINILIYLLVSYIKNIKKCHNETNFPSQLSKNNVIVFRLLFGLIATTWNGYPIGFILWKTNTISMENVMIIFVCLDFISKGASVLTLLAYKHILYNKNGFLVRVFRRVVKVQPIIDVAPPLMLESEANLKQLEVVT